MSDQIKPLINAAAEGPLTREEAEQALKQAQTRCVLQLRNRLRDGGLGHPHPIRRRGNAARIGDGLEIPALPQGNSHPCPAKVFLSL